MTSTSDVGALISTRERISRRDRGGDTAFAAGPRTASLRAMLTWVLASHEALLAVGQHGPRRQQHLAGAGVERRLPGDEGDAPERTRERDERQQPPSAADEGGDGAQVDLLGHHSLPGAGSKVRLVTRHAAEVVPTPTSVLVGTRSPKRGEYHPRTGSVSPRCSDQVSAAGSSRLARQGSPSRWRRPRQHGAPTGEGHLHGGPQVEEQTNLVAACRLHLVDHFEPALRSGGGARSARPSESPAGVRSRGADPATTPRRGTPGGPPPPAPAPRCST